MSTERQAGEAPPDDPVEYFLEDITHQGKTSRTRDAYERVLRDFESYLESRDLALGDANHRDCMAYVHQLRGTVASSTVASYASYLHRFYDYMHQVGVFEENPMTLVLEEIDESITTDPARRDISVAEMREFVGGIGHPLDRAVVVTLVKTGVRAGELCNLDRRDLSLAEPPDGFADHRAALDARPDSIYVPPEPSVETAYNGEVRTASNKRKRATTIPVDDELATVLRAWLAVRPDPRSDARPLFCSTAGEWGARLSPDMVHHIVERHARDVGWYETGGGPEENVTPHYFRHFFTTHLRDRTGDRGIVKYLRGDVAQDVIDTYTHDWGNRVREVYEDHVYRLV
jgi:site-specific recombinase XerD